SLRRLTGAGRKNFGGCSTTELLIEDPPLVRVVPEPLLLLLVRLPTPFTRRVLMDIRHRLSPEPWRDERPLSLLHGEGRQELVGEHLIHGRDLIQRVNAVELPLRDSISSYHLGKDSRDCGVAILVA